MIKVGDKFNCLKDLDKAIAAYENESCISLYKRNSKTIVSARKLGIKRYLKEELIYYTIKYACYHGGRKFKSNSTGKRPNQSTFKMDCPFGLSVRVTEDGNQFQVEKIVGEHNHIIDRVIYEHLPKRRKLNENEEKDVSRMLSMHANKWLIKEHILKETGKKITLRDIHNLAARQKGSADMESLLAVFSDCNGPDLELRTNEEGIINAIFYQDSEMKRFFSLYPELLLMDTTYKLTNLRMPLYIMLAIRPNGESEIVALFLTTSEDFIMLSSMLEIFKAKNENWTKILTIFTDKDMTERDSVQQAFPQVALLLCIFHVLRCMSREVSVSKLSITNEQRLSALKALQKILYSKTEEEYEQLRNDFHRKMPTSVVRYLEANWHGCRREWVNCWQQQNVTYGEKTTNRLESINKRIKAVVNLQSPLPGFFKELISFINTMREERDHAFINTTERVPVDGTIYSLPECQYREALTPFAFSFVKLQFDLSESVQTQFENGILVGQIEGKTEPVHENNCICLFFKSMNLPCKHMFAARRIKQSSMYSEVGIAARWLKQQVQENHRVFQTINVDEANFTTAKLLDRPLSNTEKFRRADRLLQHLAELAAEGGRSQFENRLKALQDLAKIWSSNREALISPVECSSHIVGDNGTVIEKYEVVIEDNEVVFEDNEVVFEDNGTVEVLEIRKEHAYFNTAIKMPSYSCNNVSIVSVNEQNQEETISNETNKLAISRLQFPPKITGRGRPKNNTKKNGLGLKKQKKTCQPFGKKTVQQKVNSLLGHLLVGGRPEDISPTRPVDVEELKLSPTDLPSSLLNEIVIKDILKPFLSDRAWRTLQASIRKRKKMAVWLCPTCDTNTATGQCIECESCLEWYHLECARITKKPKQNWYCDKCINDV